MNNINPYAPASVLPASTSNVMPAYDANVPAVSPMEYANVAPAEYAPYENVAPASVANVPHKRKGTGWNWPIMALVLFILLVIILSAGLFY
ncbi:hypothetical protein [Chengkuizengella axinellae]|uniref:Sporulation protein YjcZ n=1 Tax=Chengkuizengella axinellae TaxID=3064388 RepID=A0ABT9J4U2_9BACL|nr:hypothetical protein [Chengkuizengella sp. 2205SS18-9]MDP5276622.1 hypothetical protein [Chengkuizengella sp. 2205SS18-9]